MLQRVFSIVILAATVVAAAAQVGYSVRFTVADVDGAGEAFATVRIYATGDSAKAVIIDVTDVDGHFSHSVPAAGDYNATVTAVGKQDGKVSFTVSAAAPVAYLGTVTLAVADNVLEGVTVTAQRPLVSSEIDRIAYDVQADGDSRTATVMDMLRKVPLVTVDGQDQIRVNGNTNFKIYKNGHPDPSMSNNPKEVLKAIPASMIKKIEVITEPGAKYDAEGVGAILNIVTVDSQGMGGVTGTVSATASHNGMLNGNGYLTTQVGKVVANVNYGIVSQPRSAHDQRHRDIKRYIGSGDVLESVSSGDARVNVHYGNIEASYEPDTLNLFTLNFGGYYYNYAGGGVMNDARRDAAGNVLYSYDAMTRIPGSDYYSFDGRADYQHRTSRKDEVLTLSYLLSTSRNHENRDYAYDNTMSMPVSFTSMSQRTRENFLEQTAQLDWVRPLDEHHKVETGLKYINRSNRSHTSVAYDTGGGDVDSRFSHTTQVAAAYGSYTFTSEKWSARAGLRYEFSHLGARFPDGSQASFHRNLSDWVPSASVSFKPDMFHSLKLAFSTRINRPGISYLNPAVVEDVSTVSYGNAALGSARTYNMSLTYMQMGSKLTFNIVPEFSTSSSQFTEVKFIDAQGRDVSTYDNAMTTRSVGVNGYVQWQLHAKCSLMFNGSLSHDYYKASSLGLKNQRWGSFFYTQLTQQLPWKLRLSANVGKWGGNASGLYSRYGTSWFHGLGLQRSFLAEDRLTVSLNAQNPFSGKWHTFKMWYTGGDYTGHSRSMFPGQRFSVSVSYRFGSLKASVKKTDTTIENSDIVGGNSKK